MKKFRYVKVHKNNPILFNKNGEANKLRQILVKRREVHKLFDLVKCNLSYLGWFSPYSKKARPDPTTVFLRRNMHLLLRENYLTFEELLDLEACE